MAIEVTLADVVTKANISLGLSVAALAVSIVSAIASSRMAARSDRRDTERRRDELRPTFTAAYVDRTIEFTNNGPGDFENVAYAIVVTDHERPAVQWIHTPEGNTSTTGDLGPMRLGSSVVRAVTLAKGRRGDARIRLTPRDAAGNEWSLLVECKIPGELQVF